MRAYIYLWAVMGLLAGVAAGCRSYDRSANLWLVNASDYPVHYWVSCDSALENIELRSRNLLAPHDSIMPYLLFGPEGKGESDNTWVNAINRADDSSLHVFFMYIDLHNDPDVTDSLVHLVVKQGKYRADSLNSIGWRIVYR